MRAASHNFRFCFAAVTMLLVSPHAPLAKSIGAIGPKRSSSRSSMVAYSPPATATGRVVRVEFEFNEQLRGLLDVAKVALGRLPCRRPTPPRRWWP